MPAAEEKYDDGWLGKDLKETPEKWIYTLTEQDKKDIAAGVKKLQEDLAAKHGDAAWHEHFEAVTLESFDFGEFGNTLKGRVFDALYNGMGFHLLRGLDIENYDRSQVALVYWCIGLYFGAPVSQNAMGHLLGHIFNLGDDPNNPTTRIYRTAFKQRFHTDLADIVGLLCLHQSKSGGESSLASTRAIFNVMQERRPDLVKVLQEPIIWDRKGETPEGRKHYYKTPIFMKNETGVAARFCPTFLEAPPKRFPEEIPPLAPELVEAIAEVEKICDEVKLDMDFFPGDVQLVNNWTLVHARGTYEDFPEPEKKRHLLRLWLKAPENLRQQPAVFKEILDSFEGHSVHNGIIVPGTKLKVPLQPE